MSSVTVPACRVGLSVQPSKGRMCDLQPTVNNRMPPPAFAGQPSPVLEADQVYEKLAPVLPVFVAPDEVQTITQGEIEARKKSHFQEWLGQFPADDQQQAL